MPLIKFPVCLVRLSTFLTNSTLTEKISALMMVKLVSCLRFATELLFR